MKVLGRRPFQIEVHQTGLLAIHKLQRQRSLVALRLELGDHLLYLIPWLTTSTLRIPGDSSTKSGFSHLSNPMKVLMSLKIMRFLSTCKGTTWIPMNWFLVSFSQIVTELAQAIRSPQLILHTKIITHQIQILKLTRSRVIVILIPSSYQIWQTVTFLSLPWTWSLNLLFWH